MTPIAHNDIKTFVRTLMGCKEAENISFSTLADNGVLSVDYYIEQFIPLAVDYCIMQSPRGGVNVSYANGNTGCGINLPNDFARLIFMFFVAGNKPVAHIENNDSPLGKAQWNAYTSSNTDNYVVVRSSERKMDIFPSLHTFKMTFDKKYASNEGLYTENKNYMYAVGYTTASFIYESWGHLGSADRMKKIAKRFLS